MMLAMMDTADCDPKGGYAFRSIADTAIASRFQAWLGASGRRYTVSVFAVDLKSSDRGLPEFEGCVVIPICRDARTGTRFAIGAYAIENFHDARPLRAAAATAGLAEWHVHLLADDRASRETAVADLRRRLD